MITFTLEPLNPTLASSCAFSPSKCFLLAPSYLISLTSSVFFFDYLISHPVHRYSSSVSILAFHFVVDFSPPSWIRITYLFSCPFCFPWLVFHSRSLHLATFRFRISSAIKSLIVSTRAVIKRPTYPPFDATTEDESDQVQCTFLVVSLSLSVMLTRFFSLSRGIKVLQSYDGRSRPGTVSAKLESLLVYPSE